MGNAIIGALRVVFGADTAAFEKGATEVERRMAKTQKSLDATANKFTSAGTKLSIGLTAPLTAFGVSAFDAASDAAELQSAFNQTFGAMSGTMNKWAEETGDALGRSTQEMQKAANTFGIFFNTAVDPAKAAAMSQTFAKLAQDLGSFYNVDTETAIEKLRSGLSGESEPLRDFGVFLTEATVQAKAMEMGLSGVGNELTEQEKILARYQLIMEATANAQGDVERTGSGTANQMRAAKAAFEELQVTVGTKLLPVFTPLIEKIGKAFEWFSKLPEPVQNVSLIVGGLAAALGPVLIGIGGMVSAFSALLPVLAGLGPVLGVVSTALLGLLANPIILGAAAVIAGIYLAWKNWDQITAIVTNVYNSVKTWIVDKMAAVWSGVKWAVTAYIDLWTTIPAKALAAVQALYNGVKTWIGDKLNALWQSAKDKIEGVKQAFFHLYDAVVGHSYIPDMVDGIAQHMGRLQAEMVAPAQKATEATGAAFSQLSTQLASMTPGTGIPGALEAIGGAANDNAGKVEAVNVRIVKSFKDMATETISAVEGLGNAIKSGGALDIMTSVLNLALQLGSIGAFGKKVQTNINTSQSLPGRAVGGNVMAGQSYVVGERGEELFTPASAGTITPNHKLGYGGGGSVTNIFKGNLMTPEFFAQIRQGNVAAAQAGGQIGYGKVMRAGSRRLGA